MHFFSSKTIFYYLFIWFILKFPLDCLALGLCVAWVCYSAMQPVMDDGWPQSRTERSSELEVTHQGFFSVWVSQNHFVELEAFFWREFACHWISGCVYTLSVCDISSSSAGSERQVSLSWSERAPQWFCRPQLCCRKRSAKQWRPDRRRDNIPGPSVRISLCADSSARCAAAEVRKGAALRMSFLSLFHEHTACFFILYRHSGFLWLVK